MADDSNKDRSYAGGFTESGFDASIPVWDGKAESLREFRRMTMWWLHSINLEKTKEFNLAARFAMKQKGAAKLRALEFTPEELAYIPAETAPDPDTDETLVITPAKYDAGIQKILDAHGTKWLAGPSTTRRASSGRSSTSIPGGILRRR